MLNQGSYRLYSTGMSCLELTTVRQELSSNLFKLRNHFLGSGERANGVIGGCSAKYHKIILKAMMVEYFLSTFGKLQPKTF